MKQKKLLFFIFLLVLLMFPMKIYAGGCDVVKKPATNCHTGNVGTFSDPSMANIIKYSCPKNTQQLNYCSTYCREDAKTIFPKEIGAFAADQYDAILGGNHFRWDDVTIQVSRECLTVVDYKQWYKDYERAVNAVRETYNQYIGELHQQSTDKIIKKASDKPYECRIAIGIDRIDAEVKSGSFTKQECNMTEMECKGKKGTWSGPGNSVCPYTSLCVYKVSAPTTYSCDSYNEAVTKDGEDKFKLQGTKCVRTVYNYGNWRQYTKLSWNDAPPFRVDGLKKYCDLKQKPYMDQTSDEYFYEQYTIAEERRSSLLAELRKCKNITKKAIQDTKSSVVVSWKDPVKKYSIGTGNKLSYPEDKSKTKVKESVTVADKAPSTVISSIDCGTVPKPGKKIDVTKGKYGCQIKKEETGLAYVRYGTKVEKTYYYNMPKTTYRYILKNGQSVSNVTGANKTNHSYIDIGYPNYPIHFTTKDGTYPISLSYTNIGSNGYFIKNGEYKCDYKVINRVVCVNPPCETPPPTLGPPTPTPSGGSPSPSDPGNPGNPNNVGLNVVYRPISLTNPFPGEKATSMTGKSGRNAGANWSNTDIQTYITNNRGVKQNEVYNQLPLYSFTLDASAIRKIRNYNKGRDYNDFNLKCNSLGKQCVSNFLKNIKDQGVKVNSNACLGKTNFYGCAGKTNQDRVKCYLVKNTKKLKCIDCALKENQNNGVCKNK